jgi:regulator of sigma E protease
MSWFITKVATPILVLGFLVFFHELGHFLLAKWNRVGVLKFSVGFGPALLKWRRKETTYQLSAIPLGGYVRMVGDVPDPITGDQETDELVRGDITLSDHTFDDDPPEVRATLADRSRWFIDKGYWAKSGIVFAGPFFNLILAFFVVFGCTYYYGQPVPDDSPTIGSVVSGSPAETAGLKSGDKVVSLNGSPIGTWADMAERIHNGDGSPLTFVVVRDGVEQTYTAQPAEKVLTSFSGETKKRFLVGINANLRLNHVPADFMGAVKFASYWTTRKVIDTVGGIYSVFSGVVSSSELAGPVYIFQATGQQAEKGLEDVMYLMALLSISLAVLNLLPIPILDGGHLLFFTLEALLGPISIRKKEIAQQVGLALLLGLMVFAFKNDLTREPMPKEEKKPSWEEIGKEVPE